MKKDVVAIIHTYAQDKELGSYMKELVNAFAGIGCKLHLMITNDLVLNLAEKKLSPNISEEKIIKFIKQVDPVFVFTTNRGGITKKMMSDLPCPLVTWMVDRIPFLHHGGSHDELFCEKDYVITSSYGNVKRLEHIYPILKNKVFFFPFCTDLEDFVGGSIASQDINISFVGTFFYCGQLTEILKAYSYSSRLTQGIIELALRVEQDYDLDFEFHLKQCDVECVLTDFNLDLYKFKGLLANAISLNKRIQTLDAISDLGLRLYGTENWRNVSQYSLALLSCYQFNDFIKTRAQLVLLYQRSKIAVNVSHHQAVNGLPYRIYDIMASNALLITEYREDSDLFRLFGKDMPIPMYRSPLELHELCQYYLENESERIAIVRKCNNLVSQGFLFQDRVKDFFTMTGMPVPEGVGEVVKINVKSQFGRRDRQEWIKQSIRVTRCTNESFKRFLLCSYRLIVKNTTCEQRMRLKRMAKRVLPSSIRAGLRNYIS
jgi:hypothetical protein